MDFIKKNARHSIQVQDIADAVGISRWLLARKFREVLGSSIIKQLNHSRVELIKRMIDDGSSISNIAKYVKFTDENHIARLFKRETGITPKEYRQKVREICCWDIFE